MSKGRPMPVEHHTHSHGYSFWFPYLVIVAVVFVGIWKEKRIYNDPPIFQPAQIERLKDELGIRDIERAIDGTKYERLHTKDDEAAAMPNGA